MSAAPRVETITEASLQEAARLIQAGELVAFPTETVYGLGADATNDHAVARILRLKVALNLTHLLYTSTI